MTVLSMSHHLSSEPRSINHNTQTNDARKEVPNEITYPHPPSLSEQCSVFFAKVPNVLFNCSIMCQLQVKNPLAVSLNFLVLPKQQIISVTSNGRCPEVQRGN
jgi:hypothetical protein